MKILCKNCSNVFSAEHLKRRLFTNRESNFFERKPCCPFCLCDELGQVNICKKCGNFYAGDAKFCSSCLEKLKREFVEFLEKYSVDEQEVMLCE